MALIAGFALASGLVWGGWHLLFGPPLGGFRYVALAIALAAWRATYLWIANRFRAHPAS
jgi:hypothetical protein